jgi:hypothetical protein
MARKGSRHQRINVEKRRKEVVVQNENAENEPAAGEVQNRM